MRKLLLIGIAIVAMVSLATLGAACSDDDDGDGGAATATEPAATEPAGATATAGGGGTTLDFDLTDFAITGPSDAPAGDVTFNVTNGGAVVHELVVISTDLAPDALPVSGDTVDEAQVDVVFEIEEDELGAGASASGTTNLPAGSYVLICNVATHYDAGMYAGFTVQ